ncbi:MAG: NUDIX domain-containing protein [Patescibacteria group bacterium]
MQPTMQQAITAGIIVFRKGQEGLKFLILYHRGSYWNFPKGHVESEEKIWQAALREVREETGLKQSELHFMPGFRAEERFVYRKGKEKVLKVVSLFLAETRQPRITVSDEHNGYGWFTYPDARRILSKYKDSVRILEQAHDFLRGKSVSHRSRHPQGHRAHLQRSSSNGGTPPGVPGGREHAQ